ncbi:TonB-dependent receptor [uncultured Sphingomonas sp.]|uniref:TonB-dependent receptor n=1 Tax=uncultured Sphingomonas sp. TaxID=158754 RepID=UPI0025ED6509|nr:TonB-dependent receptor [uncultured Sphingomonas sp.]
MLGAMMNWTKWSLLSCATWIIQPCAAQTAPPASGAVAPAEAAAQDYLPDIVVTAEKREAGLQRVPQAITALTGDALVANNINSFQDLSALAPGLTVGNAEGERTTISIRGVGQEANQNDVAAPSVSYHQDGVYIVSPFALGGNFLDVGRVEVLRGPQGTLFGQNSTGGAINLVTAAPKLGRTEGYLDAAYGSFDYRNLRSAVNLPIGSTMAVRGAASWLKQDGTTTNIASGQKLDQRNDAAWRIQLLWQPVDTLRIDLTAQQFRSDTNGPARFGLLDPTPRRDADGDRQLSQDSPSHLFLRSQLYSAVVTWDLPGFTVKYLGSHQREDIRKYRDNDFSNVALVGPLAVERSFYERQDQAHRSYTSELNLVSRQPLFGAVDWVLGAFWFQQKIDAHSFERVDRNRNGVFDPFNPVANNGLPPAGDIGFQSDFFPERRSFSFYGQATWHATERLRMTGGLRYTDDRATNRNFNFFTLSTGRPTANITSQATALTGRAAVEFDLGRGRMAYASYTRGFKPGGNNLTFGIPDVAEDLVLRTFRPERIDAYELGLKADFLDGRLRANLAGFGYDYTDLQYMTSDPRNRSSGVANIPHSRILGAEAELTFAPSRDLRFNTGLTFLDSKISGHVRALDSVNATAAERDLVVNRRVNIFAPAVTLARAAVIGDLYGNELAKTPAFSGTAGVSWSHRFGAGPSGYASGLLIRRGAMQSRVFNNPAIDHVPGYTQVNLTGGVRWDSGWDLSLSAQNLFDTDGISTRFTDVFGVNATFDQLIPPRTIVARVRYSF